MSVKPLPFVSVTLTLSQAASMLPATDIIIFTFTACSADAVQGTAAVTKVTAISNVSILLHLLIISSSRYFTFTLLTLLQPP